MDDRELMRLQAEALFRHDDNGRLLSINDVGSPPAPRFFLGHTAAGSIFRFRFDLPDELRESLTALSSDLTVSAGSSASTGVGAVAEKPGETVADAGVEALGKRPGDARLKFRLRETVSDGAPSSNFTALVSEAFGSLERFEQIRAALETHAPIRQVHIGPAYFFPTEPMAIPPLASEVIQISSQNQEILYAKLGDWVPDLAARRPCLAIVRDGRAVAICVSSRLTPRAAEAGVETIAEYRGRGFGAAVVAAWSSRVRHLGLLPLYSTAWDNLASQGVARRLGLVRYGIDVSFA